MAGRVLVVDDDAVMGRMLVEQLEDAGYEAVCVGSGTEALALVETRGFAAILSDIQMPGIDGFDLLRELRARGNDTPFLLMTAFASPGTARECREAGALGVLAKPFSANQLLELLERAVDGEASGPRNPGASPAGALPPGATGK